MLRKSLFFAVLVGWTFLGVNSPVFALDWLTMPGKYSHDPKGVRVAQYQPPEPAYQPQVASYTRGGYRHTRSTLQYDQGSDNLHIEERWGPPVQPYEQWRFPFRPYGSPYPDWGAPYAGLNVVTPYGFGFGGVPGRNPPGVGPFPGVGLIPGVGGIPGPGGIPGGGGFPVPGPGGFPVPGGNGPGAVYPPWDGSYPNYGEQPRLNDPNFYYKPNQPADGPR